MPRPAPQRTYGSTALKARDLRGPALSHVVALYPMVDHRTTTKPVHEIGPWDQRAGTEAWERFLAGQENLALTQRLLAAGVATELHVRFRALRKALGIQPVPID